jgi:hypothetical protein
MSTEPGGKVKTGCWSGELTTLSTTNPTLNWTQASSLTTWRLTVWGITEPVVRLKTFCEWYSWHLTGHGHPVWSIQFENFCCLINYRVCFLCFSQWRGDGPGRLEAITEWVQHSCWRPGFNLHATQGLYQHMAAAFFATAPFIPSD